MLTDTSYPHTFNPLERCWGQLTSAKVHFNFTFFSLLILTFSCFFMLYCSQSESDMLYNTLNYLSLLAGKTRISVQKHLQAYYSSIITDYLLPIYYLLLVMLTYYIFYYLRYNKQEELEGFISALVGTRTIWSCDICNLKQKSYMLSSAASASCQWCRLPRHHVTALPPQINLNDVQQWRPWRAWDTSVSQASGKFFLVFLLTFIVDRVFYTQNKLPNNKAQAIPAATSQK